jgi:hypothetical protein
MFLRAFFKTKKPQTANIIRYNVGADTEVISGAKYPVTLNTTKTIVEVLVRNKSKYTFEYPTKVIIGGLFGEKNDISVYMSGEVADKAIKKWIQQQFLRVNKAGSTGVELIPYHEVVQIYITHEATTEVVHAPTME